MSLSAKLLAGVPPFGLGIYGRDSIERGPWSWRSYNAERTGDVREQFFAGGGGWLWAGPASMRPDVWQRGVDDLEALAVELGASGIIVDPEGGWPQISRAERERQGRAFGERCAAASVRVGMTSYPLWPARRAFVEGAGGKVWGTPQIYGISVRTPDQIARAWDDWTGLFGAGKLIPSIAAWRDPRSDLLQSAEGYADYLSRIPHACGAIAFDTGNRSSDPNRTSIPSFMRDALAGYHPGGSAIGTVIYAARAVLARPEGAIMIGVLALIVGAVVLVSTGVV